jgi:putative DNA methylase
VDAGDFAAKLEAVFAECHRVLKDDGLLVFTYHHSRAEGWSSLAEAVLGAGFSIVNAHPVKAEMSVATPKAQAKEPIQLDVILVCRKRTADDRECLDDDTSFQRACVGARRKVSRLDEKSFTLSVNDRRVTLFSQFLVEACAGRSAEQLIGALAARSTALDVAAVNLLSAAGVEPDVLRYPRAGGAHSQLMLLERGGKVNPSGSGENKPQSIGT